MESAKSVVKNAKLELQSAREKVVDSVAKVEEARADLVKSNMAFSAALRSTRHVNKLLINLKKNGVPAEVDVELIQSSGSSMSAKWCCSKENIVDPDDMPLSSLKRPRSRSVDSSSNLKIETQPMKV